MKRGSGDGAFFVGKFHDSGNAFLGAGEVRLDFAAALRVGAKSDWFPRSMRWRSSAKLSPADGSASSTKRRCSIISRCPFGTGTALGSAAKLSQIADASANRSSADKPRMSLSFGMSFMVKLYANTGGHQMPRRKNAKARSGRFTFGRSDSRSSSRPECAERQPTQ